MARKKLFFVVAHIKTRTIVLVAHGPFEKKDNRIIDSAVYKKHKELFSHYSLPEYDVIITRSNNLETLKKDFPEFCEWEYATHTYLR